MCVVAIARETSRASAAATKLPSSTTFTKRCMPSSLSILFHIIKQCVSYLAVYPPIGNIHNDSRTPLPRLGDFDDRRSHRPLRGPAAPNFARRDVPRPRPDEVVRL